MTRGFLLYIRFVSLLCFALFQNTDIHGEGNVIKVACVGNSVTYGYGLTDNEHTSYPAQLQQLLGSGYQIGNFGHSGATLSKKGHNPYYKCKEFNNAIAFQPDIVIIDLGLNDTDPRDWPDNRENFESDYAWLIGEFRQSNPDVKVWICRLTPIFSGHPRFKSGTRDWYWQIQGLIPEIAKINKTRLVDLHTPLYARPDLFKDNLHPDKEGAGIIANTIYQSITGNFGGFKLDKVFTDHMVLQRRRPVSFFGTANADDEVSVAFQRHKIIVKADDNGRWKAKFPPSEAGGPYQVTLSCGRAVIQIDDVLIGDVWLCSGQSNMAFPLASSTSGKEELTHASKNTQVRIYKHKLLKETDAIAWDTSVMKKVNNLEYFSGSWQRVDSMSASTFSAVSYYFGKQLSSHEHIPIGLIQVAVGGSPIESWIDRYTMEHDDLMVDMMNGWQTSDFLQDFCRGRAAMNLKLASNAKQRHPYEPCYNYEAGIKFLTDFPITGVVWYQGESNAHNLELYHHAFPILVSTWRKKWKIYLPFYFVQLSAINRPSWPAFRNMERRFPIEVPGTYMTVSMDLGDSLNVHYFNKKPIGERLAQSALRHTYKRNNTSGEAPGPLYATLNRRSINVVFPKETRLKTKGTASLSGFEVVDEHGLRICAEAKIRVNSIDLYYPRTTRVSAIYYAMQPYTRANLTDGAGFPVSTFVLKSNTSGTKYLND
jgi:sialate O-acetylesterase